LAFLLALIVQLQQYNVCEYFSLENMIGIGWLMHSVANRSKKVFCFFKQWLFLESWSTFWPIKTEENMQCKLHHNITVYCVAICLWAKIYKNWKSLNWQNPIASSNAAENCSILSGFNLARFYLASAKFALSLPYPFSTFHMQAMLFHRHDGSSSILHRQVGKFVITPI